MSAEESEDISSLAEVLGQLGIADSFPSLQSPCTLTESDRRESRENGETGKASLEDDGLPSHGVLRNDFLLAVPKGSCGICFEAVEIKVYP